MATSNQSSSDPYRVEDTSELASDHARGSAAGGVRRVGSSRITPLQSRAWILANMSYLVPDGSAYRAHAAELYEQDLHERILAVFAALDAQNAVIDAVLAMSPY